MDRHSHDAEWERVAELGGAGAEGIGEELGSSPKPVMKQQTNNIKKELQMRAVFKNKIKLEFEVEGNQENLPTSNIKCIFQQEINK